MDDTDKWLERREAEMADPAFEELWQGMKLERDSGKCPACGLQSGVPRPGQLKEMARSFFLPRFCSSVTVMSCRASSDNII